MKEPVFDEHIYVNKLANRLYKAQLRDFKKFRERPQKSAKRLAFGASKEKPWFFNILMHLAEMLQNNTAPEVLERIMYKSQVKAIFTKEVIFHENDDHYLCDDYFRLWNIGVRNGNELSEAKRICEKLSRKKFTKMLVFGVQSPGGEYTLRV